MKSFVLKCLLLACLPGLFPTLLSAQSLTMERVATGMASPIFATHAPTDGERLFIAQRAGAIRILNLNTGNLNGANFMTVPNVDTFFEGGLLGLAFHPNYQENGFFYVNYTITAGGSFRTRIARFTRTSPDTADPSSQLVLLEIAQPAGNHNAGWIGFGPDGYLYIATGDGGGSNDSGSGHTAGTGNAQDITNNLLGKMLRVDVDGDDFPADPLRNYAIPKDNPFVGITGDDEIFLYGLRNPFRCSFDRENGDLYMADVGQGAREEISFYPGTGNKKRNMGWRLREGTITTPGGVGGPQPADGVNPIYDYPRTGPFGGSSVTGGIVYRGPIQALQGNYFFADYNSFNLWSLRYDGSNPDTFDGTNFNALTRWTNDITVDAGIIRRIVAMGEDLEGNMYLCNLNDGSVFKLVDGFLFTDGTLDLVLPFVGDFESGSPADLLVSDDVTLNYRSEAVPNGQPAIQIEFRGTVPSSTPALLKFDIESRVSTPNLHQQVEIFNFLTNQYELFDSRTPSLTDVLISIEIAGATAYTGPIGDVRTRVTLTVNGPVTAFPWALIMDRVGWQFID